VAEVPGALLGELPDAANIFVGAFERSTLTGKLRIMSELRRLVTSTTRSAAEDIRLTTSDFLQHVARSETEYAISEAVVALLLSMMNATGEVSWVTDDVARIVLNFAESEELLQDRFEEEIEQLATRFRRDQDN
jgi:hypothetical protein